MLKYPLTCFYNEEFKVIAGSMLAGMKAEHSVVRMRQHLSVLLSFTVWSVHSVSECCISPHTCDSLLSWKMHMAKLKSEAFSDCSVSCSLAGQQCSNRKANQLYIVKLKQVISLTT